MTLTRVNFIPNEVKYVEPSIFFSLLRAISVMYTNRSKVFTNPSVQIYIRMTRQINNKICVNDL